LAPISKSGMGHWPHFKIWSGTLAHFKIWNGTLAHFNIFNGTLPSKSGKSFDHSINLGRNIASLHDLERIMSTHSCHSNKKLIKSFSPAQYWT
jgi:hypothetical protein